MPRTPPSGTPRVAALRLLGRRDYTVAELTQRLVDRGYPAGEVRTAVDQLAEEGAVDDRRTALAHARTASRVKGRGVWRITRELEARGIAPETIREATAQLSPDDERRAIEQFIARRRVPKPIPPDQRRRIAQQLLRRGFSSSLVRAVLDEDDLGDL